MNPGSTTSLRDDDRQDPLDPAAQVPSEIPVGFDRRRFIMRGAVISAAAVLTGCTRAETERTAPPPTAAAATPASPSGAAVRRPERGEERAGAGDDGGRRVLQGGAGPLELAHDRADAHYLRLLPAVHEAAGGSTRKGDGTQGAPVRQPQRHGTRARHGARRARGAARPGAGHRRSRCFSTRCATNPISRSR